MDYECEKENEIESLKNSMEKIQLELNGLGNTPGLKTEVDRLAQTTSLLVKTVETFSCSMEKINKFMISHTVKEEVIHEYELKIHSMNNERKKRNWSLIVVMVGWGLTLTGLMISLYK